MGDCRCSHVPSRKGQSDGERFIRMRIGGARYMIQVCPECHKTMSKGGVVCGIMQGSGKKQNRDFRRFPGDLEKIWYEVQVI